MKNVTVDEVVAAATAMYNFAITGDRPEIMPGKAAIAAVEALACRCNTTDCSTYEDCGQCRMGKLELIMYMGPKDIACLAARHQGMVEIDLSRCTVAIGNSGPIKLPRAKINMAIDLIYEGDSLSK